MYKKLLKNKKLQREVVHGNVLINTVASMFEYSNVPTGLDTRLLERILITHGVVGICKLGDEYVAVEGSYSGEVDARGRGKFFTGAVPNHSFHEAIYQPENGYDGTCVVGWNNTNKSPDANLIYFADMLAETDVSMKSNIRFARYNPLLSVRDNKEKHALEEIMKKNEQGDMGIIVSKNIVAEFNEVEPIQKIDLFDVNKIDKIQYLSKFHDDLMSRFYFLYGMDYSNGTKLAQQSVAEVCDGDKPSMILPLDRLAMRKKMVQEINDLWGFNMTVEFSEPWRIQEEEIKAQPQEEQQEEQQVEQQEEQQEKGGE